MVMDDPSRNVLAADSDIFCTDFIMTDGNKWKITEHVHSISCITSESNLNIQINKSILCSFQLFL